MRTLVSWEIVQGKAVDALRRIVGCALVVRMPSEGLGEALGFLKDALDFWRSKPPHTLPQPRSVETTARVVSASIRAPLTLTE